jgi:hypothetical protein
MKFTTFDAPLPPGDRAVGEGLPPGRQLAQLLADGAPAISNVRWFDSEDEIRRSRP